jgi:hypothetical protein
VSNPLQNLKIDYWYKAVLVIGAVSLIISLTIDIKGVGNIPVLMFSLSAIFVGIGEWINHPLTTVLYHPNINLPGGLKGEGYIRKNSMLGMFFVIIGVVIAIYQIWKLIN